ncbi:hypothetical protein SETIT_6G155500v2 [Setaria italica]|uniref:Uncharacterized protein n=1 Tax=Setaria italica TaxID=4555 RepID=A0A368RM41_SETIT|nr:hypothetical protein SETIT_6G155500v2 [Setaria italica]RCV31173.1 hypothetical protein SETIT_6G155500v2 [Setaria italica]
MLSPRGSHGAHPLPAGGRCSRRGYCLPYCWPSGTTILYPRVWVGIYSVDDCGFTINPQHHPLPPSSQVIPLLGQIAHSFSTTLILFSLSPISTE